MLVILAESVTLPVFASDSNTRENSHKEVRNFLFWVEEFRVSLSQHPFWVITRLLFSLGIRIVTLSHQPLYINDWIPLRPRSSSLPKAMTGTQVDHKLSKHGLLPETIPLPHSLLELHSLDRRTVWHCPAVNKGTEKKKKNSPAFLSKMKAYGTIKGGGWEERCLGRFKSMLVIPQGQIV